MIVGDHHTDENTLLFIGGYLCRLIFPITYNILNLIKEEDGSVFEEVRLSFDDSIKGKL